jgi:hypothetical protein
LALVDTSLVANPVAEKKGNQRTSIGQSPPLLLRNTGGNDVTQEPHMELSQFAAVHS